MSRGMKMSDERKIVDGQRWYCETVRVAALVTSGLWPQSTMGQPCGMGPVWYGSVPPSRAIAVVTVGGGVSRNWSCRFGWVWLRRCFAKGLRTGPQSLLARLPLLWCAFDALDCACPSLQPLNMARP